MSGAVSDPPDTVSPSIDPMRLRRRLARTVADFAETYGIAARTVEDWESGRTMPDAEARRRLAEIADDPAGAARNARLGRNGPGWTRPNVRAGGGRLSGRRYRTVGGTRKNGVLQVTKKPQHPAKLLGISRSFRTHSHKQVTSPGAEHGSACAGGIGALAVPRFSRSGPTSPISGRLAYPSRKKNDIEMTIDAAPRESARSGYRVFSLER